MRGLGGGKGERGGWVVEDEEEGVLIFPRKRQACSFFANKDGVRTDFAVIGLKKKYNVRKSKETNGGRSASHHERYERCLKMRRSPR